MNTAEYQQLRQEIVRLKQEIAMRPVRVPTRGGGAAPAASMNGWMITGVNNALLPTGLKGIKWITTPVLTTTIDYSNLLIASTNATDTGIGIARNVLSDELRLVTTYSSPYNTDLINANIVSLAGTPLSLEGVDGLGDPIFYSVYKYYLRF